MLHDLQFHGALGDKSGGSDMWNSLPKFHVESEKIIRLKRKLIFTIMFRVHVKLGECRWLDGSNFKHDST